MKYSLTILFFLIGGMVYGQTAWHYGVKFDLHFSQVDGNGMQSAFTPGIQMGVFTQRVLNKKWSIQPELLYTRSNVKKGDKFLTYYNNNIGRSSSRENIHLNLISLPVLVRYELWERFTLLAGPQYSYLFQSNENLLRSNENAFKRDHLSANLGAQFNLGGFGFSVRYNKGISDINNIDDRYNWASNNIDIGFTVKIK